MAAVATNSFLRGRNRILVASADPSFRKRMIADPMFGAAHSEEATGGAHALAKLDQFPCDGVLLDRNLPDLDAAEVADMIRQRHPLIDVELVDSRRMAARPQDVEAREEAAADRSPEEMHFGTSSSAKTDAHELKEEEPLPQMIGSSKGMREVFRLVRMVAPRETTVLVSGETGTGKELVAQAIHELSPRARHPFVVLNCAAIPETLLEAELFGHTRGAFTGAAQSRLGRVHVAQGGTLFLDEIGELPISMQAKLLRFLQNGEVQRLGSSDVYRVDVRVVCATNVRLMELVEAKQFRADLYYRLAVFPIVVPPLRHRRDDIRRLTEHFVERLSREQKFPPKRLAASAIAYVQESAWAGNVRELEHAVERAFILSGNDPCLQAEYFQPFGELSICRAALREI